MTKVIIIDDERPARENIIRKLTDLFPAFDIVGVADSAEKGYDLILELEPDLLYLDIAMPIESGFDLLRRLPQHKFELIFITGFDQYAIDAIKFCAIGYVLKPIKNEEFVFATNNALKRITNKNQNERISQFLDNMTKPLSVSNKLGIPTSEGLEFVAAEEIIRCEGVQKCTILYAADGRKLISSYNIGEYKKMLEPYGFLTVHKSHVINPKFLKKYHKEGTITMTNNSAVPVSKRKRSEFLASLKRL